MPASPPGADPRGGPTATTPRDVTQPGRSCCSANTCAVSAAARRHGSNYIDIILVRDVAAARNLTHVEIPSLKGGYRAFYNPGGPGPEPFQGMRYTAPGPPGLEPVLIALDDPMRASREAVSGGLPWLFVAISVGIIVLAGSFGVVRHSRKQSKQRASGADMDTSIPSVRR
jgi:hypothetical protein